MRNAPYRECAECGATMDPGEGRGGICDDCVRKAERKREMNAKAALALDMAARGAFAQMEAGDFI